MKNEVFALLIIVVLVSGCVSQSMTDEYLNTASEFCRYKTGISTVYVRNTWSDSDGIVNCHFNENGVDLRRDFKVSELRDWLTEQKKV